MLRTAILLATLVALPAHAQDANRYTIHSGVLSGFSSQGEPPPITIMLDRVTGQTWMLAVVGDAPQWISLPYNGRVPADALPPRR